MKFVEEHPKEAVKDLQNSLRSFCGKNMRNIYVITKQEPGCERYYVTDPLIFYECLLTFVRLSY